MYSQQSFVTILPGRGCLHRLNRSHRLTIMNSQVVREYDIRGIVANDFDDEFVTDLGRGYATLLHQAGKKTVTLGRDCRLSSDRLRDRLAEGLLGAGIDGGDSGGVGAPR